MKNIFLIVFLFITVTISFAQNNNKFDFDKYRTTLKKENNPETEKVKNWLIKSITTDEKSICTKNCSQYLSTIPDDMEIENEENPGNLKNAFYKKWSSTHDMQRIPGAHPFELGNGGCNQSHALNPQFIGGKSNEYYFNVIIYCDNNKSDNNKLILKIVNQNGKYLIDDVLSQAKSDFFAQ